MTDGTVIHESYWLSLCEIMVQSLPGDTEEKAVWDWQAVVVDKSEVWKIGIQLLSCHWVKCSCRSREVLITFYNVTLCFWIMYARLAGSEYWRSNVCWSLKNTIRKGNKYETCYGKAGVPEPTSEWPHFPRSRNRGCAWVAPACYVVLQVKTRNTLPALNAGSSVALCVQ